MTDDPITPAPRSGTPARPFLRPLLWVLLVIALAANGITSLAGLPIAVSASAGVLTLVLAALLVRDHHRRRARS
jgi:hypothetical protein